MATLIGDVTNMGYLSCTSLASEITHLFFRIQKSHQICTTVRRCIKGTTKCLSSIDHEAIV